MASPTRIPRRRSNEREQQKDVSRCVYLVCGKSRGVLRTFVGTSPQLFSRSTQGSSFGVRMVVHILARVMLTRKFCRAWLNSPSRELDRTIRSRLETILPFTLCGHP